MRENSIGVRDYWVNRDDCVIDESKVLDQVVGSRRLFDQGMGVLHGELTGTRSFWSKRRVMMGCNPFRFVWEMRNWVQDGKMSGCFRRMTTGAGAR